MSSQLKVLAFGFAFAVVASLLAGDVSAQLYRDNARGLYRFNGGCSARGVTITPDKKILATGPIGKPGEQQMLVVKFNADHSLDTSFGDEGSVQLDIGGDAEPEDVVVDPETGNIFVGGTVKVDKAQNAFVARLTPDGELDKSFQGSGVLLHQFESQTDEGSGFGLQPTSSRAIAIDQQGRLLVAGYMRNGTDNEPFITCFSTDGDLIWSRKHGTGGFDDGAVDMTVPMKEPPFKIYTTGFSVITNIIKAFPEDGSVQIGQSSLGFCMRSFGISYDESTDRLVAGGNLGRDLVIRAMDTRPEVIPDINFANPFKEAEFDSTGRAFEHLSNGRVVSVGHGRPYKAKDNADRRFQIAVYEPDGTLVAHDRPDTGASSAALDVAVDGDSLIVVAGRVMTEETSKSKAKFKMAFVAYDGDGQMIGEPWTFEP